MIRHLPLLALSSLLCACASLSSCDPANLERSEQRYIVAPEDPNAARTYARSLLLHDDPQTAEGVMQCVLNDGDAVRASDYILAADIQNALKNDTQRDALLEKALKTNPDDLALRKRLLALYEKENNPAAAQALYDGLLYTDLSYNLSELDYVTLVDQAVMNLVTLKLYRDAYDLTKFAKDRYPNNASLERNSRIVRALMQSHGHRAPKPETRPLHPFTASSS